MKNLKNFKKNLKRSKNIKDYWGKFYKEYGLTKEPSDFAKFIRKFIKEDNILVYDLGCGNGRDSYYLSKKWNVIGIDYAILPKTKKGSSFIKESMEGFIKKNKCEANLVYARFFLHGIDDELLSKILKWSKGIFAIEFRSKKDEYTKKIFKHSRFYRSGEEILDFLKKNNYKLVYFQESNSFAKFKGESPYVIRIIAKKYNNTLKSKK